MAATAGSDFMIAGVYVLWAVWLVHVKNSIQIAKAVDQYWDKL